MQPVRQRSVCLHAALIIAGMADTPHTHHQHSRHDDDHFHDHSAGDAYLHHAHEYRPQHRRGLLLALLLTGGFALVEVAGGIYANSLALISDAGHMAADAGALLIALVAARLAARPVSEKNSFG